MDRRRFLVTGSTLAVLTANPPLARADMRPPRPLPDGWRVFETVTRLEIADSGPSRVWVPVPAIREAEWIRPLDTRWRADGAKAALVRDTRANVPLLHVEWNGGRPGPATVEVTSRVATRDRTVDFSMPARVSPLTAVARRHYLAATDLVPTDGLVKQTSERITQGLNGDLDKARAIYEWVVDNTFRDPKTRGCGTGNVAFMLQTGDLGGKCADINMLYVALARAANIPARDLYGLRVAPSKLGYKSLGTSTEVVSKAQHCRAEIFLSDYGWVPVDPADVRKVALEEPPGNRRLDDAMVQKARQALFGRWEMNWIAYNEGADVILPGAREEREIGFLMYPHGETPAGSLDCLDPETFKYVIKAREVTA